MDSYCCPICKTKLKYIQRYPNYVCKSCVLKATDVNGNRLTFSNVEMSGGYKAEYTATNLPYNSHTCYIEGHECFADEARFGGIVVELKLKGEV